MNDKRYLFRGFHEHYLSDNFIKINGKEVHGEWLYWDEFGKLQGEFSSYFEYGQRKEYAHELSFIPETVGQWVATDKHGKDLFEGDNVRHELHEGIFEVEYNPITCLYLIREGEKYHDFCSMCKALIELIGNKWEVQE